MIAAAKVSKRIVTVIVMSTLGVSCALAHRLSPGFFGLSETSPNVFAAQWKVSIPGGLSDVLEPALPAGCSVNGDVRRFTVEDARLMHAELVCESGLGGSSFTVNGLAATQTDVLLLVEFLDGRTFTHRLVPGSPAVEIPAESSALNVVTTYLVLGVEHILLGIDHLLFVLALVMLVNGWRALLVTITSFTLAHSITLAAAALGYVHMPSAPVEAVIALSIVFLATELAGAMAALQCRIRKPWHSERPGSWRSHLVCSMVLVSPALCQKSDCRRMRFHSRCYLLISVLKLASSPSLPAYWRLAQRFVYLHCAVRSGCRA